MARIPLGTGFLQMVKVKSSFQCLCFGKVDHRSDILCDKQLNVVRCKASYKRASRIILHIVVHKRRSSKLSVSFQEGRISEWRTTKDVVVKKSKKGLVLFFGNKIGTFVGTAEPR
jgi:hypothetical protein